MTRKEFQLFDIVYQREEEKYQKLNESLKKKLLPFIKEHQLEKEIFITKNGTSLDRKQIWREMKHLCKEAK